MLEFESSLRPLEHQLEEVRRRQAGNGSSADEEQLRSRLEDGLRDIYSQLTPWQKAQVARHRERPYTLDYLQWAFSDFVELHGDRSFADDRSIVGGPAMLEGRPVMVVGQQKGRDTKENLTRNFGMPHPEGYRKAERLMKAAERLGLPVVTFVDTPGAHAGLEDEERGQSEAIASSISTMLDLRVPTVCVIIGEGGSGGALAIAVADRILMLEHSTFTVASPEAAAAILWRDAAYAPDAAASMRITAQELRQLGLIDCIVPEPLGGAHQDHAAAARAVAEAVLSALVELESMREDERLDRRYD
ncbi:MAG TPA: acetyl-CoA carboxylase carboxyltransferase subunit alpha [Chloroflexota bacterium]|nr:acetyl-CoA carboxylase carboxyltransferase subunit alpha [Chloroflexota bacterium]